MEVHTIATHRVAHHLRAIAALEAHLSDEGRAALALLLRHLDPAAIAQRVEATAPIEPLTDAQRSIAMEVLLEQAADMSTGEHAEALTGDWTEADWRDQYETIVSYMTE